MLLPPRLSPSLSIFLSSMISLPCIALNMQCVPYFHIKNAAFLSKAGFSCEDHEVDIDYFSALIKLFDIPLEVSFSRQVSTDTREKD